MDTNRSTEPKPIQEILAETVASIKERANKYYETATPQRETAMAKPGTRHKLDFEVGDLVQIQPNAKKFAGRIGRIIGIRYTKTKKGAETLAYCVQFSDKEANNYVASSLTYLSSENQD